MTIGVRVGTVEDRRGSRPVVVVDDGLCFLDEIVPDTFGDVRGLIAAWERRGEETLDAARAAASEGRLAAATDVSWLPPLIPRKLLCVGANYHDHVAEMDRAVGLTTPPPPFPYTFLKPPTALVGSDREVAHPSYARKLDWEVELAVVIGDPRAASGPEPLEAVFGYTILNDLSLRDFLPFPHALGLDAVVSKGFDGGAPAGPCITLAADVPDPQALGIELSVNGEIMQSSSTTQMIFSVRELIAHYARVLTLEPGDLIATGTPAGVGAAREPPRFLSSGDVVQARIEGLGCLTTTIVAPTRTFDPLPTAEVTA